MHWWLISLCINGLLSFLWTINMHYLHRSLVPRFILVLVVTIYWIHVVMNPLLHLRIRVSSCNRMGKNREGKATIYHYCQGENTSQNLWKRNLSVGRQAGRQAGTQQWSLGVCCAKSVCVCVCAGVGIYLSAEVNHEEGRREDKGGLFRKSFVLLLRRINSIWVLSKCWKCSL